VRGLYTCKEKRSRESGRETRRRTIPGKGQNCSQLENRNLKSKMDEDRGGLKLRFPTGSRQGRDLRSGQAAPEAASHTSWSKGQTRSSTVGRVVPFQLASNVCDETRRRSSCPEPFRFLRNAASRKLIFPGNSPASPQVSHMSHNASALVAVTSGELCLPGRQVDVLVVRHPLLPAAIDNPNPFEGNARTAACASCPGDTAARSRRAPISIEGWKGRPIVKALP